MKEDKPIKPWMRKVAKSIVLNTTKFYDDYKSLNCTEDVAQEIANSMPSRNK